MSNDRGAVDPAEGIGFRTAVVITDTPHNREGGLAAGRTGTVIGISYEHDDHGEHVGYAVSIDGEDTCWFVLPDGLRRANS